MNKEYITKDSGNREEHGTGAVRDVREGKGRFDLMSPFALERYAGVMERGAQKYFKDMELTIESALSYIGGELKRCRNVQITQVNLFTLRDCADLAMKRNYAEIIRVLLKSNSKTGVIGQEEIQTRLKNFNEKEKQTQSNGQGTKGHRVSDYSPEGGLQSEQIHFYWRNRGINAQFAEEVLPTAQNILTIKVLREKGDHTLGLQEDICVVCATTDWECWETTFQVLREHYNILKTAQLKNLSKDNLQLHFTGDRNWEKGMPLSRFMDSALRHMFQHIKGDRDEDHLGQALWNIAAIMHMEEMIDRGRLPKELDDFPDYTPIIGNTKNSE